MSLWTNVNGSIRLNYLPYEDETLEEILGKIVLYNSENQSTTLPCGSEGSLEYKIIETTDYRGRVNDPYILVYGDLRDYEDSLYIENWFKRIVAKLSVREAVLSHSNGYGNNFVLTAMGDTVNKTMVWKGRRVSINGTLRE